jgi:hypothetical protein
MRSGIDVNNQPQKSCGMSACRCAASGAAASLNGDPVCIEFIGKSARQFGTALQKKNGENYV